MYPNFVHSPVSARLDAQNKRTILSDLAPFAKIIAAGAVRKTKPLCSGDFTSPFSGSIP
jgi:hypothetical protein